MATSMNEIPVDPFEFYAGGPMWAEALFGADPDKRLKDILILETRDGVATEAILPIAEYRRLKAMEEARDGQ